MRAFLLMAGLLVVSASPAAGEVRAVEREGFIIHIEQEVAANADAVFGALTRPADWWDSEHSWSGDARNFSMEARVGGCWCEAVRDGMVEHGRIVSIEPGARTMVMNSLLGPLRDMAQSGRLLWRVESLEGGQRSRVRWTYRVGILPSGNPAQDAAIAAAADRVLTQQLVRLAAHASDLPMPAPPP